MSASKSVPAHGLSRMLLPMLLLLCGALLYAAHAAAEAVNDNDPPGRVARVNLLDGHGSLQLAGSDTWIEDLVNRPLTDGDKLWIESGSRAEVHIGSAVLRLGASTALQFVTIDDRTVRLRVTAGSLSVRVRQLETDEVFNIETPAGNVELLAVGGYRFDVADREERARVAVWSGRARVQGAGGAQQLRANESAEIYGGDQPGVSLASAGATDSLDLWAESRDRREDESRSARYVSRDVVGYEELDGYGDWVTDPQYGSMWVPQRLSIDWAPYRFGYWNWIGPWGWTWIDDAPWGFAPCHYGRWVHRDEGWGWIPGPVHSHRPVFAPALVAWVGGRPGRDRDPRYAPRVGWVPLGYNEVYRPPYRASRNYLQNANASNTHLEHGVLARALDQESRGDNRDSERGQHRYAHQDVAGAVTMVSRDTFISARPVGRNRLTVGAGELRSAPMHTGEIDVRPGERSLGRPLPQDRPVKMPGRAVFERPVYSANPGVAVREAPARTPMPMPAPQVQREPMPVSRDAPQVREIPQRREYPQVREMPQVREIPQVREAPQVREMPQVREAPQVRQAPPVYTPPPQRPVMVTPRPTYTPPSPRPERPSPPPQMQQSAPQVQSPVMRGDRGDRGDRADRGPNHFRG